jgi:hypothetical protein
MNGIASRTMLTNTIVREFKADEFAPSGRYQMTTTRNPAANQSMVGSRRGLLCGGRYEIVESGISALMVGAK